MQKRHNFRGGFALPTVLIASVVMLTILAVSVSSVTAVRTTIKTQYYEQLAKAAGEAGVAYAKACLSKNANVPLWTDSKPLRPSTDCAGNPLLAPEVQVLVVAGGGGGGQNHGGGGGGGGVVTENSFAITSGQNYAVTIGGGGAGGATSGAPGGKGGNSSFGGALTAEGGGGGGSRIATDSVSAAGAGGSGGGGAGTRVNSGGSLPAGGLGEPGQGNNGGGGSSGVTAGNGGGGGGAGGPGATAVGTEAYVGTSGAGGNGLASDISGNILYYGAGGSGGRWAAGEVGAPGMNGGGIGGNNDGAPGRAGAANTGAGGGGGGGGAPGGGAGGSGIVVVRYGNTGSISATGGTITTSGAYRIHTFTSSGSFNVSNASNSSCPTDPRCSVMVTDELRSSFSVSRPTLDTSGRALTIPNSGYVELIRASTGEVWRTYRQPSVQSAAVPDLCSGAAASGLGWQNAIVASKQDSIPNANGAQSITLVNGALSAGQMYFRKDFAVTEAGSYNLLLNSSSNSDLAEAFVDGTPINTTSGSVNTASVALSAGCHTITIRLTNKTLTPAESRVTAAIQKNASNPIVATGSSWRVSAGSSVHFSQSEFYADPGIWNAVNEYTTPTAQLASSAWQSTQGDIFTRMIAPPGSGCGALCPASSSGYLRDDEDFYLSSPTDVQISTLCDDDCAVFLDGEMVIANSPWSSINQQTLTLTPGLHRLAARVHNTGTAANPAGVAISVVDKDSGVVLARTDRSWLGATTWTSGLNTSTEDIRSYEKSFRPSPDEIPRPATVDLLVVGGGGGGGSNSGGGGGGGGVIFRPQLELGVGNYTVSVGAGGAIGTNSGTTTAARGQNGENSTFWSFTARGGGGGASRDNGPAASSGGSGGGGAGTYTAGREVPGAPLFNQGFSGGYGTPADQGVASKGGGGGGAGGAGVAATNTVAGNGGAGLLTYITGSRLAFAGGGGGGNTASNGYLGAATDGGVSGGVSSTNASANSGGGGGGNSGAGGSGIVIIRVPAGSMSITTTGSPVVTNVTIAGVAYTIYRYNSSGTFRVLSIN